MRLPLVIVATVALAACATSPGHGSRSRLVYVAGSKVPCSNGVMKSECLQYREQANQPWQPVYAPIDGFDWKQGNEYLLSITEVQGKNPVQDKSPVTWHVEKVVEQHPVP